MQLIFEFDVPRQVPLAHLTLKLFPSISGSVVVRLGHNLMLDPIRQTAEMDSAGGAAALARVKQHIVDMVFIVVFFLNQAIPAN